MSTPAELEILNELRALHAIMLIQSTDTLTIEQASFVTGLTTGTLKEYVNKKKIGAFKPGIGKTAKLYFDKAELEKYKRRNPIKSDAEITSEAATHLFKKAS